MDFPATNKTKNKKKASEDLQEKIDSNGKKIQDALKKLDIEYLEMMYLKGLILLCFSIFLLLTTIKLVYLIFDIIYLWL